MYFLSLLQKRKTPEIVLFTGFIDLKKQTLIRGGKFFIQKYRFTFDLWEQSKNLLILTKKSQHPLRYDDIRAILSIDPGDDPHLRDTQSRHKLIW